MKKFAYILFIILSLSASSYANQAAWNMKFVVPDPRASVDFCKKILEMHETGIPNQVKFRDSPLELHFFRLTNNDPEYLSSLNRMTLENTFIKNHATVVVNDLDYYLERFIKNNIRFLGPIGRHDGIYQVYFEIPNHAYLEFQSRKMPKLAKTIRMRNVNIKTEVKQEPQLDPFYNH